MLSLILLAISAGSAMASVTPTAPGPGDTFAAGSDCTIKWTADTTGQWTNMSIYLMSGSNNNMTRVTKVASGLDGMDSDLSPYKWTCPEVDPYSAIYFYQLTNGDDTQDSTWTTRFTITSPDGDSQPPEHDTQPGGDAIPWGEGHSASEAKASSQATEDDSSSAGDDDGDDDNTTDDPSTATRTHRHDPTSTPSGTASSSLYWTANSLHPRPTSSARSSGSRVAAEDVAPTASLPSKKAHVSHSGSPSSSGPASSETSCSGMGPGVSQIGGMKLASAASPSRGGRWPEIVPFLSALLALLL